MSFLKKLNRSTRLTIIVFISFVLLKFFLHYLELGFFEDILFEGFFALILFLLAWAILMGKLFYRRLNFTVIVDFLIIGATYSVIHFVMSTEKLDRLEWKINYSKRQKIIELIKEKQSTISLRTTYRIPFSLTLFPYFKSNDVEVDYQHGSIIKARFFTDRGLLDHYSAFVYCNDSTEVKQLDTRVRQGGNEYKIEPNWYYLHDE